MVACEVRSNDSWTRNFRPPALVVRANLCELRRCIVRIDRMIEMSRGDEGLADLLGQVKAAARGLGVLLLRMLAAEAGATGSRAPAPERRVLAAENGINFLRGYLEVARHLLAAGERPVALTLLDRAQDCLAQVGGLLDTARWPAAAAVAEDRRDGGVGPTGGEGVARPTDTAVVPRLPAPTPRRARGLVSTTILV